MRTPCRGYASLRKATDPYGSRYSSHHIAGGCLSTSAVGRSFNSNQKLNLQLALQNDPSQQATRYRGYS